ncbi:MAG: mechanosensitive ion channel family protein [Candidatus Krumholzibacteria bacterium]|nr:mechanosensitive ion channel family protein [Candidatus Krumholzibacteria bacterium]
MDSPIKDLLPDTTGWTRAFVIVVIAIGAHIGVLVVRRLGAALAGGRMGVSFSKLRTVSSLVVSVAIFALYFGAFGMILSEMGLSLKAYLASASILGLAIGFGSQGFVQDVVTGLTIIFSDLLDIGDMVEISGQVGIVHRIGLRFTVLVNSFGAEVFIPNRTIGNVVNYPKGYVRYIADVTLSKDPARSKQMEKTIETVAQATYEQYPGVLPKAPSVEGKKTTLSGRTFLRVKFRLWPGRVDVIDKGFKPEVVQALREIDPDYADWMVVVNLEVEKKVLFVPRQKSHR